MLMEVKKIKFSYQDKPFIEELSVKFKKPLIAQTIVGALAGAFMGMMQT